MRNNKTPALIIVALAFLFVFESAAIVAQTSTPQRGATTATKPTSVMTPPPTSSLPAPKPTPAVSKEDEGDYEVVRVTSNLVVVPVSVTDAAGQPVLGLKATEFHLEEEGRAQEITQIGDPEQVPLEIAVLLDVSGSVDARFAFEQQAAASFIKQVLKPADRATVFAIDQTPRLEQPLGTAEAASATLVGMKPAKGPTAFYDAVIAASQYLAKNASPKHRRVIVVISDGEDTYSDKVKTAIGATTEAQNAVTTEAKLRVYNRVLAEVQREVQSAEVAFYSINPSGESLKLNIISTRAQAGMQHLAEATGGTSFVPEKPEDLNRVFQQIAAELRSQYLLQYYSSDESESGKFLRIKVAVPTHTQLRVRARQGYYAKRK